MATRQVTGEYLGLNRGKRWKSEEGRNRTNRTAVNHRQVDDHLHSVPGEAPNQSLGHSYAKQFPLNIFGSFNPKSKRKLLLKLGKSLHLFEITHVDAQGRKGGRRETKGVSGFGEPHTPSSHMNKQVSNAI